MLSNNVLEIHKKRGSLLLFGSIVQMKYQASKCYRRGVSAYRIEGENKIGGRSLM